ncbi:hypothetical protein B484DRAFT_473239, partial [Ochromonadaceae sp. CCMP2298]
MPDLTGDSSDDDDDADADQSQPRARGHFRQATSAMLYVDDFVSANPAMEMCGTGTAVDEGKVPCIVDTGCTGHVSGDPENQLGDFVERSEWISLGKADHKVQSFGRGTLGPLEGVMYAPDMSFSMVSVSALDVLGCYAVSGNNQCVITRPGEGGAIAAAVAELSEGDTMLTAALQRKLYHVDRDSLGERAMAADPSKPVVSDTVVPYTFAANRSEIKGSYGSERHGTTAGLNPLELLYLRTGHSSKE